MKSKTLNTIYGSLDISHLSSVKKYANIQVPAVADPKKVLLEILFSIHCVTKVHKPKLDGVLETYPLECRYMDSSGIRIYCAERYSASKHICKCIDILIDKNLTLFKTEHGNYFFTVSRPDSFIYFKGESHYYIFLKIIKEKSAQNQPILKITVESAYVRESNPNIKSKGPVLKVLGDIWSNKK